ncbi:MAG: hypothetical protein JKY53_06445 [Flavobacteriales bacterium]|nr:hypothetical protein [Flavobacteriales bacterium]
MGALNSKIWLFLLLTATGLVYLNSLNNDLLSGMDDDTYILDNVLIKSFDLKAHFTTYIAGNYHPLTTLSYAVENFFFGENKTVFHSTNLLLHLLNVFLVFLFISKLLKDKTIALISAAVFALHPMHVESVSWVSERKDLLYSIFYLNALIFYLKKNIKSETKHLVFSGVFFIFATVKVNGSNAPITLFCD